MQNDEYSLAQDNIMNDEYMNEDHIDDKMGEEESYELYYIV